MLPTYNERENLPLIVERLLALNADLDILVVDDNSPDGTGDAADALARVHPEVHVLHRANREGLGRAYVAGFSWALEREYQVIVQMDADLSHNPKYIPAMLAQLKESDLVLGSRYVPGGGVEDWGLVRRWISRCGSWVARAMLGIPYRDLTGGFKAWRRETLERIDMSGVRSNGYCFQIEMTFRAHQHGARITELPIIFPNRRFGTSKMRGRIVWEAIIRLWQLRSERD
ncbi:MAG TPA: polyprenol monophosphomannose synthase [Armatimonadota bacterium]|nr:polyprenol monophosphomannose synthase [Armatimonadota bacterium]HPT99492.1 polyprenol monophosphomannose synthase [Armatimonadota bacterium]